MEPKKKYNIEEITSLFQEAKETQNTNTFKKAVEVSRSLLINPVYPPNNKFEIYKLILEYENYDPQINKSSGMSNISEDVIAGFRDGLMFLKGVDQDNMIDLLTNIIKYEKTPSYERLYTTVQLYNMTFISVCYSLFEYLIFDNTLDIEHRIDAAKFLFANDDYYEVVLKSMLDIISNPLKTKVNPNLPRMEIIREETDSERRYKVISSFISRTGIKTTMNFGKLRIPYNETFVYKLQTIFFHDERNDVRFRILSGQHLLQMNLPFSEKEEIINFLFKVANDDQNNENTRADAADVILRLGNKEESLKARKLITQTLGMSTDGKQIAFGPKIMYDNSQNIHSENLNDYINSFLVKLVEEGEASFSSMTNGKKCYKDVENAVSECIRKIVKDQDTRNVAYSSLLRISVDTATFTTYNITTAEVIVYVWSKIHSGTYNYEIVSLLEQRFIDELIDMADTCSSGGPIRLVNVFSAIEDTYKISWEDQLKSNVKGRMNAKIKGCTDDNVKVVIALGMMGDDDNKEEYLSLVKNYFDQVRDELYEEFVMGGWIKGDEFETYMSPICNEWLKS